MTVNPLLIGKDLPPFDKIKPEDVEPAITELLQQLTAELNNLEKNITPTWSGLVEPLTQIQERLNWSWGIVGHLMGVKNSPELRQAYEKVQPEVIKFYTKLGQSQPIYQGFKSLKNNSKTWEKLEPAQKRIIDAAILEAELSGVGLEGEKKDKFNKIQLELGELATNFSNHVLDATKAFKLKLTTPEEVAGLPPSSLSLAAQTARETGEENATPETGPWVITLDYPSYIPMMKYNENRELREQVYKAFITRASSGELDNNPLIQRILELRQAKAHLLGFNTYAELSLATKMADNVTAVEKLLEELRQVSYDAAVAELNELKAFATVENPPQPPIPPQPQNPPNPPLKGGLSGKSPPTPLCKGGG